MVTTMINELIKIVSFHYSANGGISSTLYLSALSFYLKAFETEGIVYGGQNNCSPTWYMMVLS